MRSTNDGAHRYTFSIFIKINIEKNNALYWLVSVPVYAGLNDTMSRDIIFEYKDNVVTSEV